MGLDPAARGEQTDQPARVASLATMCRQLTAELFEDAPTAGRASAEPPAAQTPSAPQTTPRRMPPVQAHLDRAELMIPPPQPHQPAWPRQSRQAPTVITRTPAAPDADSQHAAARDLAAINPRRFGGDAEVPATLAPAEPAAASRGDEDHGHNLLTLRSAIGDPAGPHAPAILPSAPHVDPADRPHYRSAGMGTREMPAIPDFLGPAPLTASPEDRPAGVVAPVRHRARRSGAATRSWLRAAIPTPRVSAGAVAGTLMFVAVAGAGVAGAALAPQLASLLPQGNAPHIVVEEVEGVADAVVPLPVSVETADGTVLSTVVIEGVPEGARLSAGRDSGDGSWVLPPEELPDLAMVPPRGFAGEISLEVRAVAVDGAERVGQSETMHVVIMPPHNTPQIRTSRRT